MSFLNDIPANEPVASLEGYFMAFHAPSKFGKTSFAINLAKEYYGNLDSTLLLATEIGYKTIKGVRALPIVDFEKNRKKKTDGRGFVETVDELIKNKNDVPYRFIIIDTLSALERLAVKHVVQKGNIEDNPEKRYQDVSDFEWGKGYNKLADAIYNEIDKLKKAGFGVLLLGHSKDRQVTLKDGKKFDLVTFDAEKKVSAIIEREADVIIYGDMGVKKEGKKVTTNRVLRLHSDGNVTCGARFGNFPETIDNSAEAFLEVFKEEVLKLYDGDESKVEEAKKREQKQKDKEAEAIAEDSELGNNEEIQEKILELATELDDDDKPEFAKQLKAEIGTYQIHEIENREDLIKALEIVESY